MFITNSKVVFVSIWILIFYNFYFISAKIYILQIHIYKIQNLLNYEIKFYIFFLLHLLNHSYGRFVLVFVLVHVVLWHIRDPWHKCDSGIWQYHFCRRIYVVSLTCPWPWIFYYLLLRELWKKAPTFLGMRLCFSSLMMLNIFSSEET